MPSTQSQPTSACPLTGENNSNEHISLEWLKGKKTILVFYPKDNTPGCTNELKQFRDLADTFSKLGYQIVGISKDSLISHQKFKLKLQLPFELAADTDEILCQHFGVISEKSLFGHRFMGIVRSTFVLDEALNIKHEWRKVSVGGHAQAVLDAITK